MSDDTSLTVQIGSESSSEKPFEVQRYSTSNNTSNLISKEGIEAASESIDHDR